MKQFFKRLFCRHIFYDYGEKFVRTHHSPCSLGAVLTETRQTTRCVKCNKENSRETDYPL